MIRRVAPLFGLALLLSGLPHCSGSATDGLDLGDHDSAPSAGDEATSVGDEVGAVGPDAPSGGMHHRPDSGADAGDGGRIDATVEASVETGTDATADVAHDATHDAITSADAGADASDASLDAAVDSGSDAPICLVGTCAIGARQCSGNDVFGCTMGSDGCGLWGKLATCTDQSCVSGACTGVCAPGQTKCTGTATAWQGCSPLGLWGDPAPCTGSTPVCNQGACVACGDGGTPCPDGG